MSQWWSAYVWFQFSVRGAYRGEEGEEGRGQDTIKKTLTHAHTLRARTHVPADQEQTHFRTTALE